MGPQETNDLEGNRDDAFISVPLLLPVSWNNFPLRDFFNEIEVLWTMFSTFALQMLHPLTDARHPS